jgi:hypothetical protein
LRRIANDPAVSFLLLGAIAYSLAISPKRANTGWAILIGFAGGILSGVIIGVASSMSDAAAGALAFDVGFLMAALFALIHSRRAKGKLAAKSKDQSE